MNATGGSFGSGSLASANGQASFDISRESDVIGLLKFVHNQPIDPDTKNELRDAIFAFRQSTTLADLEIIQEALKSLGVSVTSGHVAHKSSAKHKRTEMLFGIGTARPQPRFVPHRTTSAHKAKVLEVPRSNPISTEVEVNVPVANENPHIDTEAPHNKKVEGSAEPQAPQLSLQDVTSRIQEIKRAVNEKVGNPVNLISQHETIGREYMNALLDAMKKVNGGSPSDVRNAMERLERAFKAVDGSAVHTEKNPTATETPSPEPELKESEPLHQATSGSAPSMHQEVSGSVPTTPPSASRPMRMSSVKETLNIESDSAQRQHEEEAPPAQAVEPTAIPLMHQEVEKAVHSVAKEKQVQDLLRLNRLKEAQSKKAQVDTQISAMDPLMTPEVTNGLDQLLSEWSHFKSSGIFGTGPSGRDHPLYKKIGNLTMAAVIAGRFDGATPAIKQSITDYMNGWRYEEGIIHEHGETFEHYLRRVVHHILRKRRTK